MEAKLILAGTIEDTSQLASWVIDWLDWYSFNKVLSVEVVMAMLDTLTGGKPITETDIDTLDVHLSTDGGDSQAGWALYYLFSSIKKLGVTVKMTAIGTVASAGTLPYLAAELADRNCPTGSSVHPHNPWMMARGDAERFSDIAAYMKQEQDAYRDFYAERTGKTPDELEALMRKDMPLSSNEAVDWGFAGKSEEPMMLQARASIDRNAAKQKYDYAAMVGSNAAEADAKDIDNREYAALSAALNSLTQKIQ